VNPEPKPPAEAVRDYVAFRQEINLEFKNAATMARELAGYVAATEDLRATLVPGDQPADFRRALIIGVASTSKGQS
jgi:hypothetical protein